MKVILILLFVSMQVNLHAQYLFEKKLYLEEGKLIGVAKCQRDSLVFNICSKNESLLQQENSYILNTSVSNVIEKPFKYTLHNKELFSVSIAEEFDNNSFLVMTDIATSERLELNLNSSYAQSAFKNFNGSSYAFDKILWLTVAKGSSHFKDNEFWFDLDFDKNHDLLLVYLTSDKKLEVWNYPHGIEGYPMAATRSESVGNGERYFPVVKQTYKLKEYLDFNIILIEGQNYLIDSEGSILLLGDKEKPEEVSLIQDYKNKTLLVDQTKDELWVIETSKLYLEMPFEEIFNQHAKKIKL